MNDADFIRKKIREEVMKPKEVLLQRFIYIKNRWEINQYETRYIKKKCP